MLNLHLVYKAAKKTTWVSQKVYLSAVLHVLSGTDYGMEVSKWFQLIKLSF